MRRVKVIEVANRHVFGGTASLITKLAEIGQPWVGEKDAVGFKAFQSATGGAARLLGAPAGKIAWSCKNAAALWPAPQHYQTACEKPGHMLNDKSEGGSPLYIYIYMWDAANFCESKFAQHADHRIELNPSSSQFAPCTHVSDIFWPRLKFEIVPFSNLKPARFPP